MLALALLTAAVRAEPVAGDVWEPFRLRTPEGATFEWRPGQTTVVSFYAFWCDTWKDQVPRLRAARQTLKGLPVRFLHVSVDGRWSELGGREPGMLLDPGGAWTRKMEIARVPTTVVLDPRGRATWVTTGVVRQTDLVREVQAALAAPVAAGTVYLTFDDFPAKEGSAELLDALRALGVKATLFCLGSRVEAQAKLLRRAISEGHSVQCHSWDHDAERPQLERCHAAFRRALGKDFTLYRPPGGSGIVGLRGRKPVADPYDFSRPGAAEIERRVLAKVKAGSIVQLHAGVAQTVEALPGIVARLRARGFSFATLE